jgi:hypothetical protein
MAKKINREEIKAEVKRRQQNAVRDYAEKANLIAAGYKTAKTNSASGSAGKKPIGASNSKSNVLSQIDEIRNDLGSRNKLSADALMANNPAYVYTKAYGDGKTGAAANRPVKGTATPRSRFEPADTGRPLGRASAQRAFTSTPTGNFKGEAILKSALSSSGAAYKKLGADVMSPTGNLSMGESARAAINEAKTAKKEGRQVRPGQAQRKAEQEKIKSFNDGWAGDFKQKLLESAEESSKRAYEYEQEAKQGLGKFGQGVVDFGIAGAQFAGDALLNAVAPGTGIAAMAGRAYGSASLDAQQRGLSEGEQQIFGLKSAAIEVLTEKLFGAASKVAYGKGIIKNESLVNGLVNRLAKTDKGRTALKVIVGANEEGLEEVLSDILNPVADRVFKLDDGKGDWSDLGEDMDAEQMLEDYIIGSTLGLFGAGTNVISGQYRAENAQQRAYENYQRELVNAGLASEQGSRAQLTAAEYQNILDSSAKRGNRNLSDKETANLEQLITAERDTPAVRSALERSGTLVDDNTATVIAKAASGQKLTRAEQSIIDSSPVMQQAVNTMSRSGAVANIRTTAAKNSVVNSMAERYTGSPEVISRTYDLAPVESPEAFEMAFDAVYQMGQQGANKESLTKVPVLNRAQAEIAYNMGASTTQAAVDNATVQGDNVSTQVNNQINTQEVNSNGVRLRDSGQRLNGQNTEGQIPSVERGTVEAYTGTDSGRQSGYSAAQGKTGQKVVYNGVEQENVYYSGEDTESMKKGRELARSYGYNVTYFEGGNIKDSGGEFRGMVDTESKTVMVRSDHPDISAEQIMRHEMGHAAIAQGDISLDELRSAMLSDLSEKELSSAVEVYRHAYGDTISETEAFEEMCCDALGKINIFAGTEHDSANYGKVQESFRKHTAETANKGRAPPKSGVNGKKHSSEPLKYDYSKPFAEQVDDWIAGKIPKYDTLVIGATPTAFRKVGFNSLPMTINQSHVDYAINGTKNSEHHIGEALLKQLPSALEQPVAIIASETQKGTSVIALLPFTKDGKTVVAPVYIDGFGIQNTVKIDSNAVTSIYGRQNAVSNLLTKALNDHKSTEPHVFYLDKAKATALYQGSKVTVPKMPNTSDGFVSSIRDVNSPVKLKIKDVTESRQFKRWFGNSKVTNSDGTPKIVYHGTGSDFNTFDKSRQGENYVQGEGGFFFTSSRKSAESYAKLAGEDGKGRVVEAYLSIQKPYEVTAYGDYVQAPAEKYDDHRSEYLNEAEMQGCDGIIIKGEKSNLYVVFEPNQIKSATDNIGTFDESNSDIRYSREPESITELRRQNETMLAQATNEDAANENERGLIKDYKRQYDKVSGIAEKLNTARQEVLTAENGGDKNAIATARNRFTLLSRKYAEEHRKLSDYVNIKALDNVLTRVKDRTAENSLPEGMGAASAEFTGEETRGERWVTEAQGKGNNALHPISREQEANLAEQQHRAPQEIPKEDLNGKLTSKHVSTLANSGVTPAEFSDALREDAAQGKFSHIAYSDEAALKKAEITIEANGWEQALADYKAQINAGKVSKDNTVMGIALYNNAVNSGDYATALDIASLMVKNSTNTAQSLQAMRILNKLSPECKLYLAAKSVETIEEDLNEKYKDNKADIHVDKVLYDEYGKALRSGDEDGIKTAWAKIEQSVAQQIDATWYEKLNNFRYLAMLGNPRTHVRNIVGNAFFVPVRAVKNTIAYGLENVADSKVNGGIERSKAMLNRNNANDVALIKYAMTDYEAVQETILSGGKYVDTFQGIDKKRTIYKTKILEAARKGNSNLLDAEDAWFCKPAYANALAKWYKANGITAEQLNTGKVPESTIIKAQTVAIKEAQKATYRDTNRFSAMVSRLGKVDNKIASALIEGVLPFKKTPANILVRAVEYSPVGLIKSLAVDTKKVKAYVNGDAENGMSPAQFIDDVSAGLTGTALVGLGVLLASWGLFSGSPGDDDKQNKFDELGGSQNYALNIGGLSITLDWLAPESMPLFVGVELYNSLSGKSEDNGFVQNLMSSVMSLSTPMFEMSMLQSVNDLFDNLAYIKQGQGSFKIVTSMATNYISQYFPTLFGQAERAFGENQRETTYIDRNSNVGSELQYMWGKIANKIPLYDFSQIPYIDAWGRTEETGNLFERVLNNFVNPAYVKKERSTEIDGELKRLYDLGETSVYPSRAKTNTKINGEYLTAEEYVKYATVKGQTSYDLATKIINSSTYSRASDAEKAYMLSYVYKYADHIAKYEVNNESSLAKWEAAAYKSSNPAQGIIDHAQEYYKRKEDNES